MEAITLGHSTGTLTSVKTHHNIQMKPSKTQYFIESWKQEDYSTQ